MPASDWIVEDARSPHIWYFNDAFNDGVLDIATAVGTEGSHEYSSTIQNGTLEEADGYLKTKVNDLGQVGYSRLVHTAPLIMSPHEVTLRSQFVVKTWNQYSDLVLGLSFERTVGNIAYRGDLALWIDYNIAKLYYRPSRDGVVTIVELGYIYLYPNNMIILTLEYHEGYATVTANHENRVEISEKVYVGTTYEDSPVYGLMGGRGSGDVTEIWINNYREIVGKAWTEESRTSGDWTVVRP